MFETRCDFGFWVYSTGMHFCMNNAGYVFNTQLQYKKKQ